MELVSAVGNTFPLFMQFIGPAIMMIRLMKTGVSRVHWVGIGLLIFVGSVGILVSVLGLLGIW
jgi:hypothetical protein